MGNESRQLQQLGTSRRTAGHQTQGAQSWAVAGHSVRSCVRHGNEIIDIDINRNAVRGSGYTSGILMQMQKSYKDSGFLHCAIAGGMNPLNIALPFSEFAMPKTNESQG